MNKNKKTINRKQNPYKKASILSKFCFWHLKDLFKIGLNRPIEDSDIYATLKEFKSENVSKDFSDVWEMEKQKKNPSIFRCIYKIHKFSIVYLGILRALSETTTGIVTPLCLGGIVSYFVPGQTDITKNEAYLYALGIILCAINPLITFHPYIFLINRVKLKIKVAVCDLLYQKVSYKKF